MLLIFFIISKSLPGAGQRSSLARCSSGANSITARQPRFDAEASQRAAESARVKYA